MAEPETPFLFGSNSGIRSGGSCKVRHAYIEANPDVSMMSSCPTAEGIFLDKLENGNFVFNETMFDNFFDTWYTVNPDLAYWKPCKFNKL